jgi:hypothetical protein
MGRDGDENKNRRRLSGRVPASPGWPRPGGGPAGPPARRASARKMLLLLLLASATTHWSRTARAAVATASASVRTPGVSYRSIIGDPGMRWSPSASKSRHQPDASAWLQPPPAHGGSSEGSNRGHHPHRPAADAGATAHLPRVAGPRMQLFFYGLCSKAGYSNVSVVPAHSDTCEVVPGKVLGMGSVATVEASDCCTACLAEPWCLAWTRINNGSCVLKDNALAAPSTAQPAQLPLGQAVPGFCGQTSWQSAGCNSSTQGAWKAKNHGITTLAQCVAMCERCTTCNYVSFSPTNDDTGDCSWYTSCDLRPHPSYESTMVRNASSSNHSHHTAVVSGVRRYQPSQELPSPRYGALTTLIFEWRLCTRRLVLVLVLVQGRPSSRNHLPCPTTPHAAAAAFAATLHLQCPRAKHTTHSSSQCWDA